MGKRRKSKKTHKLLKKKSIQSTDTVNFFSFVAGMVSSLLLISIAYAGFRPNDVEEQANFAVLAESKLPLGISDFEKVITDGTADDAVKLLKVLDSWPRQASLPTKFDYLEKRIAIANRLLELDCDPTQRELAIESRLDAASLFYGLDFLQEMKLPIAAKLLREAAAAFVDDENDRIRRAAQLGLAKLHVFEYAKQKSSQQLELLHDSIVSVIENFKDDAYVMDNVRVLIKRLMFDDTDSGRRLIGEMYDRYQDSDSAVVQTFARELHDSLLIADANYDRLLANRWANGLTGRQDLAHAAIQLSAHPEGGICLINQVAMTLSWFEQIHDFERATEICNALIENAPLHKEAEVVELSKQHGAFGLRRISMVGQRVEIEGNTVHGKLDPAKYEDHITIVVFIASDARSVKTMRRLLATVTTDQNMSRVRVLAVSLDGNEFGEKAGMISQLAPKWDFVVVDGSDPPNNPILNQYPVIQAPHALLLDHQGNVARINVQAADIRTYIDELVDARRQQAGPSPD